MAADLDLEMDSIYFIMILF